MRIVLRGARAAFIFLTRIPVGGFPYTREEWRWASAWFPFVGAVLGAACAGVWVLAAPLGPWVAAMAVLVASMLLTGAFHEDGLADSADALGAAHDRTRMLEILKDPRVGTFGALALVVTVGFRLVLLAQLDIAAPAALIVAHSLARVGPVWLMVAMPYVSPATAKGRNVARAAVPQGLLATALGLGTVALPTSGGWLTGAFTPIAPAAACAAMAVATVLCGWRFKARAGGVTGDFLGATEQVNEIAVLLVLLALHPAGSS
jgi:adenosylcobinamide-GDP ribazoletransferase